VNFIHRITHYNFTPLTEAHRLCLRLKGGSDVCFTLFEHSGGAPHPTSAQPDPKLTHGIVNINILGPTKFAKDREGDLKLVEVESGTEWVLFTA